MILQYIVSMPWIELYPCGSKDELHACEGYHIRNSECVNRYVAGRTKRAYHREDNKNKINEYMKAYYISNKDKIIEHKEYYEIK